MTAQERKIVREQLEKRNQRSFRRNHPDFPTYFSLVSLMLVIFEPTVHKYIHHMLQAVQGLKWW